MNRIRVINTGVVVVAMASALAVASLSTFKASTSLVSVTFPATWHSAIIGAPVASSASLHAAAEGDAGEGTALHAAAEGDGGEGTALHALAEGDGGEGTALHALAEGDSCAGHAIPM